MEKYKELKKYSNPEEVFQRGQEYGIGIFISPKKDKKYVFINPETDKLVHFGAMYYEDGTKHKDPKRIASYRRRNHKWKTAPMYTPAWSSYHLTW